MNEPTIGVALVYLGMIAAGVLLPAPLIAFSARRGTGVLVATCISIALLLIFIVVKTLGDRSSLSGGDLKLFDNIVGLVVISVAAAGWATHRKRRQNASASFMSLLGTAVSMQIASLVIFALMPNSC
jgi:hypothetical protein